LSELPELGRGVEGWQAWFVEAAAQVMRWPAGSSVSLFYQSDIRYQGRWIDKSHLIQRAAEQAGATLLSHQIVCRRPPGTPSQGRPGYSHLLAFTTGAASPPRCGRPDVLTDAGETSWSRGMGLLACRAACRFVLDETKARRVVDPFCGRGLLLAMANDLGLDALGVELSAKRCRAARNASIAP
jgi:hypothetical protein